MQPFHNERRVAEHAARSAGTFIEAHAGGLDASALRSKGEHDFVTFVDEEAQRIIVAALSEAFPDDEILAEEGAGGALTALARGRRWVVDPLDGTTNFSHGVPPYAVSIALQEDGRGVVGVVLDVSSGELFSASSGGGLTLNGAPACVSATDSLDHSLIATGIPFRDYRYVEGYLAAFENVMRSTIGIRRHGAAAVDLAWTAVGRFDGFFEAGLAPWDVAAGVVLVQEGGGKVMPLVDGTDVVYSGGVVSGAPGIHQALTDVLRPLADAYRPIATV